MFFFTKPTEQRIRAFIAGQAGLDFSYSAVGATASNPPPGYVAEHTRTKLGAGQATFLKAKAALQSWKHFQLGWVEPCWPDTPIEIGQVVAVLGRVCGLCSLNACRIVYKVNETGQTTEFGFAYGTLPEHVESGEERFVVEWRQADDSVWYDILAFSRPHHFLARLGYPFVRRLQKRFARDSAAAMIRVTK
ncbi:MAG TPA: DUF1990 domain-containing protein [Gemmataceae bacterium]|jgi:uncharacterized protein (UPF0548 family)|nr:DUF1990 domain-containing protein [Gemmataceae bacterium]